MINTILTQPDSAIVVEVIIATITRRGDGTIGNPIRVITEIFTKDGFKIEEHDPFLNKKNNI